MSEELSHNEKCRKIIESIISRCNVNTNEEGGWSIAFGPDWGGNSLTIFDSKGSHTHVGIIAEGGTTEELIDQLHDLLVNGRGLSWEGGA